MVYCTMVKDLEVCLSVVIGGSLGLIVRDGVLTDQEDWPQSRLEGWEEHQIEAL